MLKHVLSADVDDKGHFRLERHDVRKVLFRSHSDVYTARFQCLQKHGHHVLISRFVREKVIRREVATWLRVLRNHAPELPVSQARRQIFWSRRRRWRTTTVKQNAQYEGGRDKQYRAACNLDGHDEQAYNACSRVNQKKNRVWYSSNDQR